MIGVDEREKNTLLRNSSATSLCLHLVHITAFVYIELQADLTTNYYLLLSSKNVILLSQTYTQIFAHCKLLTDTAVQHPAVRSWLKAR